MGDYQGVLYKRRDVFTRQWRPRWFVLQPQSGILTYYLFSSNEPPAVVVGSTPLRPSSLGDLNESVQYDVVPRGTIYLRGCHVRTADEWSRPSESLYCFIITAPDANAAPCCLATITADQRDEWVAKIGQVCSDQSDNDERQQEGTIDEIEEVSLLEVTNCTWRAVDPDVAMAGLEQTVKMRIEAVLDKYLPLTNDGPGWSLLFENKDGVTSYHRDGTMIKSIAVLDHYPKQIFNLVADVKRRKDYEKNIRCDERVKRLNSHTFIDYYSYFPVWPTTGREFLVLFHWRVVERQPNEKAIVLIGFSFPEANDLRPLVDDHVRAELEVSLFLLQLYDGNKTKATRLISYDLCGNIPRALTNNIMQQQATMPFVISSFLRANEPSPPPHLSSGEISDHIIAAEIIDSLRDDTNCLDSVRRRLQLDSSTSSVVDEIEADVKKSLEEEESGYVEVMTTPSALLISLILMTPVVVSNLVDDPLKEILFLVAAMIAIRTVVLLNLGPQLPEHEYISVASCRLAVNLRSFLRFRAKLMECKQTDDVLELSVLPLVLKAVGKALTSTDALNCNRVCIPILGVSGCFLRKDVSVSVLSSTSDRNDEIITIDGVSEMTIEQIASELRNGAKNRLCTTSTMWMKSIDVFKRTLGLTKDNKPGSCLVIMSPDSDACEVDLVASPSSKYNAIILVGGLRLRKLPSPKSRSTPASLQKRSTPLLSITVSVKCPACTLEECRRFAEHLQELLEKADV